MVGLNLSEFRGLVKTLNIMIRLWKGLNLSEFRGLV